MGKNVPHFAHFTNLLSIFSGSFLVFVGQCLAKPFITFVSTKAATANSNNPMNNLINIKYP